MKRTLTAMAAAATLALATVAVPQKAEARHGYIAGAVIGGLAAGALIGAATAPYYGPGYYYGPSPYYYGPDCYWTHTRYWNGYRWHYRRVRVCD